MKIPEKMKINETKKKRKSGNKKKTKQKKNLLFFFLWGKNTKLFFSGYENLFSNSY